MTRMMMVGGLSALMMSAFFFRTHADGAIPLIATIPISVSQPGQYEMRAALVQGETATTRSVVVNIE